MSSLSKETVEDKKQISQYSQLLYRYSGKGTSWIQNK